MSPITIASFSTFAVILVLSRDAAATCTTRPTLRLYSGYPSQGQERLQGSVQALQELLNTKGGFSLTTDGYFGPGTESAVRSWQKRNELDIDGVVGPATWSSLCGASTAPSASSGGSCGNLNNPHPSVGKNTPGAVWNPITKFVVDKMKQCHPGKITECSTYQSGSDSDHPGNAADCFPGSAGVKASGQDRIDGDAVAAWLIENAGPLKIKYIVWYERIWSVARASEGWRACNGPSATCYAGPDVTAAHFDHLHVSVN